MFDKIERSMIEFKVEQKFDKDGIDYYTIITNKGFYEVEYLPDVWEFNLALTTTQEMPEEIFDFYMAEVDVFI